MATLSSILNPLSARTISPGNELSSSLQFSVICLSLDLPPHASGTKVITPCGAIPIKNFSALWFLYDENACALASKLSAAQ